MDRLTLITVRKDLYDFYAATARQVRGYTPEMLMSDALRLYAGMVSKDLADALPPDEDSSGMPGSGSSRSR